MLASWISPSCGPHRTACARRPGASRRTRRSPPSGARCRPRVSPTGTVLVLLAQGPSGSSSVTASTPTGRGSTSVASVDLPATGSFLEVEVRSIRLPRVLPSGCGRSWSPSCSQTRRRRACRPPAAHRPVSPSRRSPPRWSTRRPGWRRLLDRPADLLVLAPLIERELHVAALRGPLGASVRQLGTKDSAAQRVGVAVERLREALTRASSGWMSSRSHDRG